MRSGPRRQLTRGDHAATVTLVAVAGVVLLVLLHAAFGGY